MARPNYQRIINAHGKLPDQLASDLGVTVIKEGEQVAQVFDTPQTETKEENKSPQVQSELDGKFDFIVDKEGKKLVEYSWTELRAKAREDGLFKSGLRRLDILKLYADKFNALPEEEVAGDDQSEAKSDDVQA